MTAWPSDFATVTHLPGALVVASAAYGLYRLVLMVQNIVIAWMALLDSTPSERIALLRALSKLRQFSPTIKGSDRSSPGRRGPTTRRRPKVRPH